MFGRILDISEVLKRKSVFLLGPRQTGKSTYLRQKFPEALYINLLKNSEYQDFIKNPAQLQNVVKYFVQNSESRIVIIDEIQKHPDLLDDVHDLIESDKSLRFILTGSSARKLKRGGVNLLGGRASWFYFYPLCYSELGANKNQLWLDGIVKGKLPSVIDSADYFSDLKDYIGVYLKDEIQAEGVTRSIQNFSRFLDIAALFNGEQVNYTSVASDAQIPPSAVRDYFEILSDTLIGHILPAFQSTIKRKAMSSSKFYLFDCGVAAALAGRKEIATGTPEYGKQFEQAVFLELKTYLAYTKSDKKLEYWRSTSKYEIDFLVYENLENIVAIEAKSGMNPTKKDFKGFAPFEAEFKLQKKIVVCLANQPQITSEGIEILPVHIFLEKLWAGRIC